MTPGARRGDRLHHRLPLHAEAAPEVEHQVLHRRGARLLLLRLPRDPQALSLLQGGHLPLLQALHLLRKSEAQR